MMFNRRLNSVKLVFSRITNMEDIKAGHDIKKIIDAFLRETLVLGAKKYSGNAMMPHLAFK